MELVKTYKVVTVVLVDSIFFLFLFSLRFALCLDIWY